EPRYQDIRSDHIPEITHKNGATIRVIAGTVDEVKGPMLGIAAALHVLAEIVPAHSAFTLPIDRGQTVFAYVFAGAARIQKSNKSQQLISHPHLVIFGDGDSVDVKTEFHPVRFLLVAGKPLGEPIARYGPFVMNTKKEIEEALLELREGTFVTT